MTSFLDFSRLYTLAEIVSFMRNKKKKKKGKVAIRRDGVGRRRKIIKLYFYCHLL